MVAPLTEEAPGVWITLDQAQLLRDMCVNATAQDAKTKIRIGEAQLALEAQIEAMAPKPPESRQVRRANNRGRINGNHGHSASQPATANPA